MDHQVISGARFPEPSMEAWRSLAERALKGADFETSLVSRSDDDIRIEPLYPRAEPRLLPRTRPDRPWGFVQRVDDPDPRRANAQAQDDIANGATGLALVFEGAPNAFGYGLNGDAQTLATVLDGIPLDRIHLRIDVHPQSRASVDWLIQHLTAKRVEPTRLDVAFGIDPAALFAGTGRLRMSIEALKASMPPSLAHFFAMGVPGVLIEADGRVYHNAGATEAQELGAMLSAAVSHLRMFEAARQPLQHSVPFLGFALSLDQDQLFSIAKIRALRLLWTRIQSLCGIDPQPTQIHAETSGRMLAHLDPETNILRNTIAAFAAATGGADSLSILPHTLTHGLPDGFARRIARNTHHVLAGESHLDVVGDPGAGSGAIETLTDALCEAAWAEFQAIESEGGILSSLEGGALQARIADASDARAADLASARRAIVGTTLYPAAIERPVTTLAAQRRGEPGDGVVHCQKLAPVRQDADLGAAA